MAAVRETFEETGLFLGAPGDVGETHNESWNQVRALGLAPDLAKLEYVGHAITPASKAFRFNARFSMPGNQICRESLEAAANLPIWRS